MIGISKPADAARNQYYILVLPYAADMHSSAEQGDLIAPLSDVRVSIMPKMRLMEGSHLYDSLSYCYAMSLEKLCPLPF